MVSPEGAKGAISRLERSQTPVAKSLPLIERRHTGRTIFANPTGIEVEEHCTRFEKLMTSVSHLTDEVLLETFMTRLYPVIRAKLECWENMKLDVVIKKAQWIKNKEVAWRKRRKRKREEARPNKKTLSPIAHQ